MNRLAKFRKRLRLLPLALFLLTLPGCSGGDGTGIQGYDFYAGQFDPTVDGGLRAAIYRKSSGSARAMTEPDPLFYLVDLLTAPDLKVPVDQTELSEFSLGGVGVAGVEGHSGVFQRADTTDLPAAPLAEGCFNTATSGTRVFAYVQQPGAGSFEVSLLVRFADDTETEALNQNAMATLDASQTILTYTLQFPGAPQPLTFTAQGETCTFNGDVPGSGGGFETISATSVRKFTPARF